MTNDDIGQPTFYRFDQSPIWNWQRRFYERRGLDAWRQAQVPHYITSNPFIADAYASIVLAYLRDLHRGGYLSPAPPLPSRERGDEGSKNDFFFAPFPLGRGGPSQRAGVGQLLHDERAGVGSVNSHTPVYVIELGSGSGRFAHHLVHALQEVRARISTPILPPVILIMTDVVQATIDGWQEHPKLIDLADRGLIDFARFDAEADTTFHLIRAGLTIGPGSLGNPPVVIANYVLDSLRQRLFFHDGDTLLEGHVAAANAEGARVDDPFDEHPDDPFGQLKLEYAQYPLDEAPYADPLWNEILNRYVRELPPCALLFPDTAIGCMRRLRALHGHEMLFIAADRGVHNVRVLAVQQKPALGRHGSFSLPVNFHALEAAIKGEGGEVWQGSARDSGLAVIAAAIGGESKDLTGTSVAAGERLVDFSPDAFFLIRRSLDVPTPPLTLDQIEAYLRLSRWDAVIFNLLYAQIEALLLDAGESAHRRWSEFLDTIWSRFLPIGEGADVAYQLGTLAAKIERWEQARAFFEASLLYNGDDAATRLSLAAVCRELGRESEAQEHIDATTIASTHADSEPSPPSPLPEGEGFL